MSKKDIMHDDSTGANRLADTRFLDDKKLSLGKPKQKVMPPFKFGDVGKLADCT
ncbi:hypothetical protein ACFL6I_13510 [candidate division KSB1 bacterium]